MRNKSLRKAAVPMPGHQQQAGGSDEQHPSNRGENSRKLHTICRQQQCAAYDQAHQQFSIVGGRGTGMTQQETCSHVRRDEGSYSQDNQFPAYLTSSWYRLPPKAADTPLVTMAVAGQFDSGAG